MRRREGWGAEGEQEKKEPLGWEMFSSIFPGDTLQIWAENAHCHCPLARAAPVSCVSGRKIAMATTTTSVARLHLHPHPDAETERSEATMANHDQFNYSPSDLVQQAFLICRGRGPQPSSAVPTVPTAAPARFSHDTWNFLLHISLSLSLSHSPSNYPSHSLQFFAGGS